jgi:HD-like signal output (HDOD) protein
MLWFSKKRSTEPRKQLPSADGVRSKGQSLDYDRHTLYSLGKVISVKPSEMFEIKSDPEGYYVITAGYPTLRLNDQIDIQSMREGEWISTLMISAPGHHILSLKSHEGFKLAYLSNTSMKSIDARLKFDIDKELNELTRQIKNYINNIELFNNSIDGYVRLSLKQQRRLILSQYESSNFIRAAMDEVERLPAITQKFIGLSLSSSISNAEITEYIKNNPSLATEVLKIVNSSYHGLQKKVSDVNYAVLYLGLGQIFQIIISANLQGIARKSSLLSDICSHSIIISNVAGLLSARRDKRVSPVVSTIGILHDVGELFKSLIKEKHKGLDVLVDQLSGPKLGSMLLAKWGIPEPICKAVELHEQCDFTLPNEFDADIRHNVAYLYVSHRICSFIDNDSLPADPLTRAYISSIGFEDMTLEQLVRRWLLPELRANTNKMPIEVQVFFSI